MARKRRPKQKRRPTKSAATAASPGRRTVLVVLLTGVGAVVTGALQELGAWFANAGWRWAATPSLHQHASAGFRAHFAIAENLDLGEAFDIRVVERAEVMTGSEDARANSDSGPASL